MFNNSKVLNLLDMIRFFLGNSILDFVKKKKGWVSLEMGDIKNLGRKKKNRGKWRKGKIETLNSF